MPARVAQQGRIHRSSPRTMRVFLVWKRRYADVRGGHTGTAPTVLFGQIARGRLVPFGWIAHGMVDVVGADFA